MARDKLGEESQSIVVMKIRRMVQFRLVLSVVRGTCCVLTIHNGKHCMDHDGLRCGWFKGWVVVSSNELFYVRICFLCRNFQDVENLTIAMKLGLCTIGKKGFVTLK